MNDVYHFSRDFLALVDAIVDYNRLVERQEQVAAGWIEADGAVEDTAAKFDDLCRRLDLIQERRELLHYSARAYQRQYEGGRPIGGRYSSQCEQWLSLATAFVKSRGGDGHWCWHASVSDEDRQGCTADIELEGAVAADIFARELELSAPSKTHGDGGAPALPSVDLKLCKVRFSDECIDTSTDGALLVSKVVEAFPDWFSARSIFPKPSDIKNRLHPRILSHLETKGGKGYRWRLSAGDPAQ